MYVMWWCYLQVSGWHKVLSICWGWRSKEFTWSRVLSGALCSEIIGKWPRLSNWWTLEFHWFRIILVDISKPAVPDLVDAAVASNACDGGTGLWTCEVYSQNAGTEKTPMSSSKNGGNYKSPLFVSLRFSPCPDQTKQIPRVIMNHTVTSSCSDAVNYSRIQHLINFALLFSVTLNWKVAQGFFWVDERWFNFAVAPLF